MGLKALATAVQELVDGMQDTVAAHSLITEREGDMVRHGSADFLEWEFLALAEEASSRGIEIRYEDTAEAIRESVAAYASRGHVALEDASSPSYPGRRLYRVTVSVPLAWIRSSGA